MIELVEQATTAAARKSYCVILNAEMSLYKSRQYSAYALEINKITENE